MSLPKRLRLSGATRVATCDRPDVGLPWCESNRRSHDYGFKAESGWVVARQFSERLTRFDLQPQSWQYFYSYIAEPLNADEADEFIHLESIDFECLLFAPRRYRSLPAKLIVAYEKPERPGEPVIHRPVIGHVNIKTGMIDAYVGVPASQLTRLATIVATGKITLVRLAAKGPVNHRSLVRSFTITTYPELE